MPDEFGEHLTWDQRTCLHTESLQILQILSSMTVLLLFSSPHSFSVGFRSEDWDSHGKRFILCSVIHFCVEFDVCFGSLSWWKIQTRSIHYKISNRGHQVLIFYLLVFDMMLCIWTSCPGPPAEKQAHNIKDPAVYLNVDMVIPPIWWICWKKALCYDSSDHAIWSSSHFW